MGTELGPPIPPDPATARDRAKQVDSNPALVRAIERLRRRLPGDERFGDGISTDDRTAAALVAREVAALDPGRPSAIQELGMGALQIWQVVSEGLGRGRGDRDLAILFTDLVGFSSWALKAGDAAAVTLLREVGDVLEDAIAAHGGRVVKRLGDGLMAVFLHPEDAAKAALDAIEGLNRVSVDGYTPKMRAGVHWGRPRKVGGDYLGVDVNIAARVADEAKADQLLVSGPACDELAVGTFTFGRAKKLRAKGAPTDMKVRRVQVAP